MRKGATLVELLVYMALAGLLLTALYSICFTSIRFYRMGQASASLQTEIQAAMVRMTAELELTRASTVTAYGSPAAVIFLSPLDATGTISTDPNGRPLWQSWICYCLDSSGHQLMRYQLPVQPPTPFPPSNLNPPLFFTQNAPGALLAHDVTAFVVSGTSPLQLSLTASQSVFRPQDNVVQILDGVICRN